MNLFSPHNSLNVKNRTVMAPMTRVGCDKNGSPSSEMGEYYVRRAQFDTGLIITESCAVNSTDAMGYIFGAQFHNDEHLEKWKSIVERVHEAGAKIWIQLFHAGRLTVPEITGGKVLSASSIKPYSHPSYWRPMVNDEIIHFQTKTPYITPGEMTCYEIEKIINDFGNSVALADRAGFDGVEIHGAHGYLVHCFMSKLSNVRTDDIGLDKGNKFLRELITVHLENQEANIDSLLLSCRVLGRKIELKFLDEIVNDLKAKGIKTIHATFVPTPKNGQVKNFYDEFGFTLLEENKGAKRYMLKLTNYESKNINFIKVHYER
jgi:2,4-dienoyl-CoA reductase-like NADH-dependent reductase (Old Yellow Enzyme family)